MIDPKDHTKYFAADEARDLLTTCRERFPDWYVRTDRGPGSGSANSGRSAYAHFLPAGNRESAEVLAGLLTGKDTVSSGMVLSGNHRQPTAANMRLLRRVS